MKFIGWLNNSGLNSALVEACGQIYASCFGHECIPWNKSITESVDCADSQVPSDEYIEQTMRMSSLGGTGYAEYQNPHYEEYLHYVKQRIHSFQFPLRVFRGLYIPKGKELMLTSDVGEHWTYDPTLFDRHDGQYGFSTNKCNVILTGLVTADQVKWGQTIINNATDYDPDTQCCYKNAEHEIELKRGEIPHELEIMSDSRFFTN